MEHLRSDRSRKWRREISERKERDKWLFRMPLLWGHHLASYQLRLSCPYHNIFWEVTFNYYTLSLSLSQPAEDGFPFLTPPVGDVRSTYFSIWNCVVARPIALTFSQTVSSCVKMPQFIIYIYKFYKLVKTI